MYVYGAGSLTYLDQIYSERAKPHVGRKIRRSILVNVIADQMDQACVIKRTAVPHRFAAEKERQIIGEKGETHVGHKTRFDFIRDRTTERQSSHKVY